MAVTATFEEKTSANQVGTITSGSNSFTAGNHALVIGYAIRDEHTAGLDANWSISNSGTARTWTTLDGCPGPIETDTDPDFGTQFTAWFSDAIPGGGQSFTVTLDANDSGGDSFYYVCKVYEVTGSSGTLVQDAVHYASDSEPGTTTFGSAPSGYQLSAWVSASDTGNITSWDAPPSNWSTLSGSSTTTSIAAETLESSTNTGTGVTFGATHGDTILHHHGVSIEIAEAAPGAGGIVIQPVSASRRHLTAR